MQRFLKQHALSNDPTLNIDEYREFWKDTSLVKAEPSMVANLPFSDSTKYWLTEVGLPAEAGYFRFDTLEVGLPTIAELKRKDYQWSTLFEWMHSTKIAYQFPAWSNHLRLIGFTLSGAFLCLEEDIDEIVTYLSISEDGKYFYVNANIICLAKCLMLYKMWIQDIKITNTDEEDRRITSITKDKIHQVDPLSLIEGYSLWHYRLIMDWIDDDEET